MSVRWQGFATGFVGLAALDMLVSTKNASGALGGMAKGAGNVARKFLSPAVPAFTKAATLSSSSASSSANAPATTTGPATTTPTTPGPVYGAVPVPSPYILA